MMMLMMMMSETGASLINLQLCARVYGLITKCVPEPITFSWLGYHGSSNSLFALIASSVYCFVAPPPFLYATQARQARKL